MSKPLGFRPSPRGTASLRRPAPTFESQPLVLIVCEGQRTEPLYFNSLRRHLRLSGTKIDIVPGSISGSDPRSIVRYARQQKKWMKRRGRRFEHIWCVFDRDEHPKIEDAFRWAGESHFELAFSNPCFELWYLLHLTEIEEPLDTRQALRRLRREMPDYRKTASVFYKLLPRQSEAVRRAEALRQKLAERGSSEYENPSTSVDRLVSLLTELGDRFRRRRRSRRREGGATPPRVVDAGEQV
jgi:hypothetical protein